MNSKKTREDVLTKCIESCDLEEGRRGGWGRNPINFSLYVPRVRKKVDNGSPIEPIARSLLRSDAARVGTDFKTVIIRAHAPTRV